ncbi:MAG: nuclear transport factor 2 family protein [Acidobacteria bacterium]|nr:nuclear transport factor 2 family protein [Acidobacteriota bacterium]
MLSIRATVGMGLLLGVIAPLMVAAGELPRADESKLIALENAWNQAQLQHDANALQELVSDEFVYTDYDGTVMNKAAFMADLRNQDYRAVLVTNEQVRVIPYPGLAIVIGTYHTKGTYKGHHFEHWGRFTDTWIYTAYKWQCVASHTNLIENKK